MSRLPNITDAEWKVMKIVWEKSPVSTQEIVDRLAGGRAWSVSTIKTLLARLVKKGALQFEKDGRQHIYRPSVSREECLAHESHSFLQRVFNGHLSPMLHHFVETESLSEEEIARLEDILKRKKP